MPVATSSETASSEPASTDGPEATDGTETTDAAEATEAPSTTVDLATGLADRTFLSTEVEGYELVDGTQIELTFDGPNIAASGGCNRMSSTWSLDGNVLVVADMAMTAMACVPSALMDQDTWLAAVLTSNPTVTLDADELTLTAEGAVVRFVDREVAAPDQELEGPTWLLDGVISGDAVSSMPAGVRLPTLTFDGGMVAVFTGCNQGSGSYEVGEGEITFGPLALTRAACVGPDSTATEQAMLATLDGTAMYEIDGDVLTLRNGDVGLMLRAGDAAAGAEELEGETWRLDSTVSGSTVTAVPAGVRTPTLEFEGGTVAVDAGCNTGSGSYEVSGDQVTFGPIATTRMACDDASNAVEQAVLAVLTGTVTFTIADGVLTFTNGDQGLMFVPA